MARRMSVAMTTQQVLDRTKTVTRRKGWWLDKHGRPLVKPGDRLTLVDRVMGFKKGERATVLAEVEVVSVRRERLSDLGWAASFTTDYGWAKGEVALEGFPDMEPGEFVRRFFLDAQGMSVADMVTRIEWRYLDGTPGRGVRDVLAGEAGECDE